MKSTARLTKALRPAALAVLAAGLITWTASGARLGWTQTSIVTLQQDEITGIEYPVRQPAFIAGVEVPLLAAATAAVLAALSFVPRLQPAKI